jgi:hypothetical protein
MVSNDDFDGKATHLICFYLHINFEQKYPKPAIVRCRQTEGIGIARSQSEALSEETDNNLALSASDVTDWSKGSNLAS